VFSRNRSQPAHERTAEQRQRAREERERRRQGLPPPPDAPSVDESPTAEAAMPAQLPVETEEEKAAVSPAAGPSLEDEEALPPAAGPSPEDETLPPAGEQSPGQEALSPAAGPLTEELAAHSPATTPPVDETSHVEPPPPPIEESPSVIEPPPPVIEEPPAPTARARPTASRRSARLTRRIERLHKRRADSHRWYRRLLARLGALLALAAVGGAIWLLAQSLGGSGHPAPPPLPHVIRITIPEGFTRVQIAALAKADHLKGDYLADSVRSRLVHPTRYGAPGSTPNLEGFLFPATYDLYTTSSSQRLVDEQLLAFRENFGTAEIHRARALGVTPYGLLTIASMIEREAQVQRDRPLIAAVIYNRLRQGMPLGIDATIRYALNDFSLPLTEAQLHNPSPYNTRLHQGLPPTTIGNPGRASIQAAAHPAHVSYLYYVAAANGCGEQVFSTSFAQFEHDATAYREAIAKNHGRVPTCHKRVAQSAEGRRAGVGGLQSIPSQK
jgi:UPF0755 protein